MAFFDKLGEVAKNIGDKTTDVIETTKLNSRITTEKNAIAEALQQIGKHYYTKYTEGEILDPAVAQWLAAIDEHKAAIAEIEAQIKALKDDPAEAVATAGSHNICPSCSMDNIPGARFCSQCGGKLVG